MGTLFRIAARNVVRHMRRTVITAAVMTAGIAVFIFFDSMLLGMDRMTIDSMIEYSKSSVKVRTPAYKADERGLPLDAGVTEPDKAIAAIEAAVPGASASARILFLARLSNYVDEIPVAAVGVDPERDARVFMTSSKITAGSWLPGGSGSRNAVVLGKRLADELGLAVGGFVIVSANTVYDNVNADEFEIVGLVDTPDPLINNGGAFFRLSDVDALIGTSAYASEIDVALPRAKNLDAALKDSGLAAAKIGALLRGVEADPIGALAKDYLAMRQMKGKYSSILIFIVLVIAGVGIVNTILMSIYSRIREIGVLRAFGLTPREIGRLFRFEGLLVGAVGSAGGAILGILLDFYLIAYGIDFGSIFGNMDMGGIPLSGRFYGEWNPPAILFGIGFGIVIAWISASIPAAKASKLEVTEALRFV